MTPPTFTLAVINTRAGRPERYTMVLDVPGEAIASLRQVACRSCQAAARPCQAPPDADTAVLITHSARCGGFLDVLGGR